MAGGDETRRGSDPGPRALARAQAQLGHYAVAAGLVAAVTLLLKPWLAAHSGQDPHLLFLGAVMVAAWQGGTGPGLFATALSVLSRMYYFLPPYGSLAIGSSADGINLAVSGLEGVVISVLGGSLRRAVQVVKLHGAVVGAMAEGVCVVELASERVLYANPRLERMLACGPGALARARMTRLAPSAEHDGVLGRLTASEDLTIEAQPVRADGVAIWMRMRITLLDHEEHGRVAVVLCEDVTGEKETARVLALAREELEQRVEERTAELSRANAVLRDEMETRERTEAALHAAEEQLHQALRLEAIGSLAGGIAHDFNNLLTIVLSYSLIAQRSLAKDDPVAAHLEEIRKAAQRAAELTRDLLSFGRRQILRPRPTDLNVVVSSVVAMLQPVIGEDLTLEPRCAPNLGKVMIDPGKLEQVLVNLVVNARDAARSGGHIVVATENVELDEEFVARHADTCTGPHVQLSVSDDGVGMDAVTLARAFEPFFSTKDRGRGTGLGLSTAFGIVRQSGGTIWADSEVGKGTTIRVYLPSDPRPPSADLRGLPGADDPAEPDAARPGRSGSLRGTERVLLVEDRTDVRTLVARVLTAAGYDVISAPDAAQALARAEELRAPLPLLLTDVVMPGRSGPELARALLARRPETKVLYMSGYAAERSHELEGQEVAFLAKPFSPDALLRKVRDVLDGRKPNA